MTECSQNLKATDPIRVAFTMPWNSIHPGLQHTATADMVLSNQFEALVGKSDLGTLIPLGAKSWEVNQDLTVYKFNIDTSRRYSDGSNLRSHDYKKSWQEALKLNPLSANNSLSDVLNMLSGIEDFSKTGEISGIETPDNQTLILKFRKPFRAALDYLVGNRFAAYKEIKGKFLGTGVYQIQEITKSHLRLIPNPFSEKQHVSSFELLYVENSELLGKFDSGAIEALGQVVSAKIDPGIIAHPKSQIKVGQDAVNEVMFLNALSGRIFSDRRVRQALQAVVHKELSSQPSNYFDTRFFSYDPQLFLPLQMGRIDEKKAQAIVAGGLKYIELLQAKSAEKPLVIYYNPLGEKIKKIFSKYRIAVDLKLSKEATNMELVENHYTTHLTDIAILGYSVAGLDPDGVYHMFGPHGAIASPMIRNDRLGQLMEDGRSIVDSALVNEYYQNVSAVFLEEAPVIHLGFSKDINVYRSDRIEYDQKILRRNEGHLYPFVRK